MAKKSTPLMTLGALGVVFGDIGTSPLYSLRSVLGDGGGTERATVLGLVSTVVWALILVVTLLYVGLLMRNDNEGEGGLLALLALLRRSRPTHRVLSLATLVAMIGAATFLGDGVITPAISVLSAAEGLTEVNPSLHPFVLPAALVIIAGVFIVQKFGSGTIGRCYGPVMLIWFLTLAAGGVHGLLRQPSALVALSPTYAIAFLGEHPLRWFLALGSVILTVTGAEALYADLGHFGRRPITVAWLAIVLPCLIVAYVGEAAEVITNPAAMSEPFYSVIPSWGKIPVLVIATLATIIASEAVIAGAFTVLHQAGGLGLLPVMRTRHTSSESAGQIYISGANWVMAVGVLAVVTAFGSSEKLASAYGVAVSTTIVMTVTLFVLLMRQRRSRVMEIAGVVLGLGMLVVVAAAVPKIATGGWLPLAIGAVLLVVMIVWWRGQRELRKDRKEHQLDLGSFAARVKETNPSRFSGDGVFITQHPNAAPIALQQVFDLTTAIPERVIVLRWHIDDKPIARPHERECEVGEWGQQIQSANIVLGYRDEPDLVRVLREQARCSPGLEGLDPDRVQFYVSTAYPQVSKDGQMPLWQQRLFCLMHKLASDDVDHLSLPRSRTTVLGREELL